MRKYVCTNESKNKYTLHTHARARKSIDMSGCCEGGGVKKDGAKSDKRRSEGN